MSKASSYDNSFCVCGYTRAAHSAANEWCPGDDDNPNTEYPRRSFRRYVPLRNYRATLFRCEAAECEAQELSPILPEGWSQTGESRFPDAIGNIASWCPNHTLVSA